MPTVLLRGAIGGLLLVAMSVLVAANEPIAAQTRPDEPKAKPAPPAPGSIVAVYDNLVDAVRGLPRMVFLTPEKYQAMLDEIERLKKQLDRPAPRAPSRVQLKGKVESNLVQLTATFDFETTKPGELVALGCGLGQATGVTLDGRTPRLRGKAARPRDERPPGPAEDPGFLVEVEKPGDHTLKLDLMLQVVSASSGSGFILDLPRAAITNLDLELPAGAGEPRLAGKPLADTLLTLKSNQITGGLGPLDKLDLSWRSAQAVAAGAVLAADGVVTARLDATRLTTEARLTLRPLSGQTKTWRLLVPLRSELTVAPADEARIDKVETSDQKQLSLRTIHLKEASSAPLAVTITHGRAAPRPGSGKAAAVGPFSVVGAARQVGSLLVANNVPEWHLELVPFADLTRRAPTDDDLKREPNVVAAYRYGSWIGEGTPAAARSGQAWLDVETELIRGQIKARPVHLLTLAGDGKDNLHWQVRSSFTVTPRWADVDRFRVQMPADCEFTEEGSLPPPDRVRGVTYDKATRTAEFRLVRGGGEAALAPFTVHVEGVYTVNVDGKSPGKAALPLPRPLDTLEQDGSVTVQTPADLELLADDTPPGLVLTRQGLHDQVWRCPRRAPDRLPVHWQPYRPTVQVASLADVTLLAEEVRVVHEFAYRLPASPAPKLQLRVPANLVGQVAIREGGELLGRGRVIAGYQQVQVKPADPRTPRVVLEYTLPLPADADPREPLSIPLAVAENTTRGEAKVRVWSEAGQMPVAAKGWLAQNLEVVPGRGRLPVLVLRSDRVEEPLALQMQSTELTTPALLERGLVRVEVATNGVQVYRASYLLKRLATRGLEVELPAPAQAIQAQVTLTIPDSPPLRLDPEVRGRMLRLRLSPDLVQKTGVLDISYRLDPGRLPATAFSTPLAAPRFGGEVGSFPTRWQVTLPGGRVLLSPEPGPGTPMNWGWRGWLPAPRLDLTASDLDRWLTGDDAKKPAADAASPSLVFWDDETGVARLVHVPQLAWMLACSLGVVLVGLVAWRLSFPSAQGQTTTAAWGFVLAVVLAALVAAMLTPTLTGQLIYGCLPGLVVLLVLGLVQWGLHERYRRQIVFLPSFSRARQGSSLLRPDPDPANVGQPSTVDAPPRAVGSSVERPT